jgi:hypothetical protein
MEPSLANAKLRKTGIEVHWRYENHGYKISSTAKVHL